MNSFLHKKKITVLITPAVFLFLLPFFASATGGEGILLLIIGLPLGVLLYAALVGILTLTVSLLWKSRPDQNTLLWDKMFYVDSVLFLVIIAIIGFGLLPSQKIFEDETLSGFATMATLTGTVALLVIYTIWFFTKRPPDKFFNTRFMAVYTVVSLLSLLFVLVITVSIILGDYGKFCSFIPRIENLSNYCYTQKAIESNIPTTCNLIPKVDQRKWCYLQVATKNINDSVCNYLTEPQDKQECYFQVALAGENELFCEKIDKSYLRSSCYYHVLKANGNSPRCTKPTTPYEEVERCHKGIE